MNFCKKLWKKRGIRITVYCIAAFSLTLCASCSTIIDSILFPAPHTGVKTGNMTLQSGEAELDAYWHQGRPDLPVIIYSHGNGETLASTRGTIWGYTMRGFSIFTYDYAEYGGSTGSAGEKQAEKDILAAYNYLTQTLKIPADRIIPVGYSVGTGPSSFLAAHYPVRGVVLCAPYASAMQVVVPFSLWGDKFPSAKYLSKKSVPVLIYHGHQDQIIPYRNGRKIFDDAMGPKKLVEIDEANHFNVLFFAGENYWKELREMGNTGWSVGAPGTSEHEHIEKK